MHQHSRSNGDTPGGPAGAHPRHSPRNGNPEPFLCPNTAMTTDPRQLGTAGAQSPPFSSQRESRALPMHQHGHSNGDTPGGPADAHPPPFSSQRESRALPMHQHGHSNGDTPGGPAGTQPPPFSSQRESRALPMHQHGYGNGDRPGGPAGSQPPSFSPQWESRALSMRRHGYGNGGTLGGWPSHPGHSPTSPVVERHERLAIAAAGE